MCACLLACPLCSQPSFLTLDALRAGLVSVATRPLLCPVCNEVLLGIDKLTIHLFSHTINVSNNTIHTPKLADTITSNESHISTHAAQIVSIQDWNAPNNKSISTNRLRKESNENKNNYDAKIVTEARVDLPENKNVTVVKESLNQTVVLKNSEIIFLPDQTSNDPNANIFHRSNTSQKSTSKQNSPETLANYSTQYYCDHDLKSANAPRINSQPQQVNIQELEHMWVENLSRVCNQQSPLREILSTDIDKSQKILKTIKPICNSQNIEEKSMMLLPHVVSIPVNQSSERNDREKDLNNREVSSSKLNIKDNMQDQNDGMILLDVKSFKDSRKKIERCNICGFNFPDQNILILHKQLVHLIDEKNSNATSEELLKNYSCHLCSKVFKMRGSLMVHMRVAHIGNNSCTLPKDGKVTFIFNDNGYSCPTCGKKFRKEQHVTQHLKTHEGKQWECDICSKMFTTKYFLKKHKRLHSGEMPYKCNICDKTFTFQQSYHKHRLYHKDDKPHTCITCGRSFKELSTLHNHERIHTGEKPFACETCGKCFRQRVSYLVHRRIHTGVMPYTCTSCGKNFRYKVSQRTHKCPAQPPGATTQQPNDLIQKLMSKSDIQEKSSEACKSSKIHSPQDGQPLLNMIDDKDQFVLIIDTQGQHVLTRESDLTCARNHEQKMDFAKGKEAKKSSTCDNAWSSSLPGDLDLKKSSVVDSGRTQLESKKDSTEDTQDFFSLVMSPLGNGLSSPTSEMEHLRVSSPKPKESLLRPCDNSERISENMEINITDISIQSTYNGNDIARGSLETINEESLKQLLYGIGGK